ncbi:MAG: alpha-ketoacid dehydrogenase subunit beta [Acidimicrobiia bacterium]
MPTDTATGTDVDVLFLDAITKALDLELDADPDVFLLGEDIAGFGGAFKVTKGLLDKYGPMRVVDMPIAESGFTGLAFGAALMGLRPVVEYQFADFIVCAFDQIINVCSRHHYRTRNPVPVVFRAPYGARLRAGPFHSQSIETYFAHTPGLKIVCPSTPDDAAGLLRSSIRDNNPVLYLENRYLYRRARGAGSLNTEPVPLGKAIVRREGTQASIITYGTGVQQALDAAEQLDGEGISIEVIDLRTLVPLDIETIVESVKKTTRAVVLHEDAVRFGYGAEIASVIQEQCFWRLDRPVVRLGAKDVPVPFSAPLEDAVLPQTEQVTEALRTVATT